MNGQLSSSLETEDVEKLRNSYKPTSVRILFVGESPPKNNFFYCKKGPLYRATQEAFSEVFGIQPDFLEFFMSKSCWLEDLFKERGKKVPDSKQEEIEEGVQRLSRLIKEQHPEVVVAVLKRIACYVEKAVEHSGLEMRFSALPFPSYWKKTYVKDLKKVLKELNTRERLGLLLQEPL